MRSAHPARGSGCSFASLVAACGMTRRCPPLRHLPSPGWLAKRPGLFGLWRVRSKAQLLTWAGGVGDPPDLHCGNAVAPTLDVPPVEAQSGL